MRKRAMAASIATAAALLTGGAVAATASPAQAACDFISVGRPYHSGSYVRANASICAASVWRAYASIERDRGIWWDTVAERTIRAAGTGTTVQGPMSWRCAGAGTYTYRGVIWASNTLGGTPDERSATNRFRC